MKSIHNLTVGAGICVILVAVGAGSVIAADQVTRIRDGATLRGKLTMLSKTLIVLERSNGATEEFTPDDIRDLRFDREPTSLQRVRTNIRGGAFDTALETLEKIRSEYGGTDRRIVTELEFLKARCQAGLGQTDPVIAAEAVSALEEFGTSHANSFHSIEATLLLAQLLVGQDSERSAELLKDVRQSGVAGFELQAGVTLGNILLQDGNAKEALAAFDDVVKRSKGNPTAVAAWYEGRIGRAECLRLQSTLDQAVVALDQLVADIPDDQQAILARVWNRLGDCQRDGHNEKAALMAYLHVDVLYPGAPAEHAQSLYWLATLWQTAGHPERAADAKTRLQNQYAGSKWARKSTDE